jgi:hypothetical protein
MNSTTPVLDKFCIPPANPGLELTDSRPPDLWTLALRSAPTGAFMSHVLRESTMAIADLNGYVAASGCSTGGARKRGRGASPAWLCKVSHGGKLGAGPLPHQATGRWRGSQRAIELKEFHRGRTRVPAGLKRPIQGIGKEEDSMRWRYASVLVAVVLVAAACGLQQAAGAGPWASRGWVDNGNMSYDNPKHGFHLVVPPNWLIEREEKFDSTFLWQMRKLTDAGNQRSAFSIKICPCQPKTPEQFFHDELAGFTQPANASQFQMLSSGPTTVPGMYDMQFIITSSKEHARLIYFMHKEIPYIVGFVWEADATPVELAEVDSVRRSMGLPEGSTAHATGPAPAVVSAGIGPIVFARGVTSDFKPVDPGTKFPAGVTEIHAIFAVQGLKAEDIILTTWYMGNQKATEKTQTVAQAFGGPVTEGHMQNAITFSTGALPAGTYRFEVTVNGKLVQTGTCEVLK